MDESKIVSVNVEISASDQEVWHIITDKSYAKELGEVFDKNAFVESEWKLGSKVHFKYEPDKIVSTGIIGKWKEYELIQVDYDFPGMDYVEKYSIEKLDSTSKLGIYAGEYTTDYDCLLYTSPSPRDS